MNAGGGITTKERRHKEGENWDRSYLPGGSIAGPGGQLTSIHFRVRMESIFVKHGPSIAGLASRVELVGDSSSVRR
jgi:hypothetical protein